ncbi:hypothetical protein [Bradyrhizobium sp. WSM1743]|uniref:hypothetical protein n=1 Tax=Bradyrhizobium sp. WSM1743 TaxID=318996 RepID=UPI000422983D|nr:hypothetical protein [Bradyrhizobium sp. WSM1743]
MRQIVSWTIIAALIAASASQVGATQSHRVREQSATHEHIRDARDAIAQPPQSSWQYSGSSAPAGR